MFLTIFFISDVVESWIADKENHVKSEEYGRDLSTVQTLLTKQETFDAGNYKNNFLFHKYFIHNQIDLFLN